MLDLAQNETRDPGIGVVLGEACREHAAGEIAFIAIVTVHPDGSSTRRMCGPGNLTTALGAIEIAKALILQDMLAEAETRPDTLN